MKRTYSGLGMTIVLEREKNRIDDVYVFYLRKNKKRQNFLSKVS